MTLIPLDIPAGFYRNGTDLEQAGRWRDGSLVRWRDNSLRPIGGWQERKASFATNPVRGMHAWEALDSTARLAGGSHSELIVMTGDGTLTDITPSDLATGREDAEVETGYGYGFYGRGFYGTPRQDLGNYSEATTWSIDNFGEDLVACHYDDGRILIWDTSAAPATASVLTNAPTNNLGLVVTEERFIFALGAGGNPRKVQWCDFEDNTLWAPASTNQAGDIELTDSGQIMQGIRTRGQTLILTDTSAHIARYSGPPFVYNFERVGTSCGAISRKAASDVDAGVFWMGQRGFFRFDGNAVQEIKCDVFDYVFGDFNQAQQSKVWSFANGQFGEIWWFYCSGNSTEIDRYVAYDYKEGHWLIGNLSRTSGVQRGVFRYPFMASYFSRADIYEHEVGPIRDNKFGDYALEGVYPVFIFDPAAATFATRGEDFEGDNFTPFAETGPISIGAGEQIGKVTKLIPDEKTQGDVEVEFKTRFYPNANETVHGPFTPTNPTSVRFSGRQMRMKVEQKTSTSWRVGNMRIDVKAGGKR